MSDYRLYYFDGSKHIETADWIEAKSDDEAIAIIRAKKLAVSCEIWERSRLVATIPAFQN